MVTARPFILRGLARQDRDREERQIEFMSDQAGSPGASDSTWNTGEHHCHCHCLELSLVSPHGSGQCIHCSSWVTSSLELEEQAPALRSSPVPGDVLFSGQLSCPPELPGQHHRAVYKCCPKRQRCWFGFLLLEGRDSPQETGHWAFDLEAHMKQHKDASVSWCNVCGRRFQEPGLLKNHMRTHAGKPGSRNQPQPGSDTPTTTHGVVQEHTAENVTLQSSQVHPKASAPPAGSRQGHVNLVQKTHLKKGNFYTWQLATKGRIAVARGHVKETRREARTDSHADTEQGGANRKAKAGSHTPTTGQSKVNAASSYPGNGNSSQDKREPPAGQVPPLGMDSKLTHNREKPTDCSARAEVFRTYQKILRHSRASKGDRWTNGDAPRTCCGDVIPSLDENGAGEPMEVGSEDGLPETLNLDSKEDGLEKAKVKSLRSASRECSYCGKYLHSNYYLSVHLQTHTRENPHKCEFCAHTAAQKASLRHHLERHHKDKRAGSTAGMNRGSQGSPQRQELSLAAGAAQETKHLKKPLDCAEDAEASPAAKLQKEVPSLTSTVGSTALLTMKHRSRELNKGSICNNTSERLENASAPYPEKLKAGQETKEAQPCVPGKRGRKASVTPEEEDAQYICAIKRGKSGGDVQEHTGNYQHTSREKPLDISTGSSPRAVVAASDWPAPSTCPFCVHRALYPVLTVHQRLLHKYSPDSVHTNGCSSLAPAAWLQPEARDALQPCTAKMCLSVPGCFT
ncbi:LOW QUALITY PROTEIN: zinc finger protein 217-like [Rhynochetos jubatus]